MTGEDGWSERKAPDVVYLHDTTGSTDARSHRKRRGTRLLSGVAAVILLAFVALYVNSRAAVTLDGWYSVSILPGDSDLAKSTWDSMEPEYPDTTFDTAAVVQASWREDPVVRRKGGDCVRSMFFLHPPSWQFAAADDPSFNLGQVPGAVAAAAAEHPEILEMDEELKRLRPIAGTQLSQGLNESYSDAIDTMWEVQKDAQPTEIKIAMSVSCGDDLIYFAWFKPKDG